MNSYLRLRRACLRSRSIFVVKSLLCTKAGKDKGNGMVSVKIARQSIVWLQRRVVGRVGLDVRPAGDRRAPDMRTEGQAVFNDTFDDEVKLVLIDSFPAFGTTGCAVAWVRKLHFTGGL